MDVCLHLDGADRLSLGLYDSALRAFGVGFFRGDASTPSVTQHHVNSSRCCRTAETGERAPHMQRLTPHGSLVADAVWCRLRRSTVAPVQDDPNTNIVAVQPTESNHELPPSPSPDTTSTLRKPSPDPPRTSSPTPSKAQAEPSEEQLPGTPFGEESDRPKGPPPANGRDSPSPSAEPASRLSPAQGVHTKTPHQPSVHTDGSVLRTTPCNNSTSVARLAGLVTPNRGGSQTGTAQGCVSELRRPTPF
jgi:hypothetical protein